MKFSRAFVYGDLLFETMRFHNGSIVHLEYHFQRLTQGASALGFLLPNEWSVELFLQQIQREIPNQNHNYRIRYVLYRDGEGFYHPENPQMGYIVEYFDAPALKTHIAYCGIYHENKKAVSALGNLKSGNALIYVEAARFAKQKNWNDAFILNTDNTIIESTSSNLFWIQEGNFFTVPLQQAPVAGVMRSFLMDYLKHKGIEVKERPLSIESLQQMDACFLTNSIQPWVWVNETEGNCFEPSTAAIALQQEVFAALDLK